MSELFNPTHEADPLLEMMCQAVPTHGSLKYITDVECTEQDGQIHYQEECYILEHDQFQLHLIQGDHDTTLA
jgi:hypothetical protein